jgi:predicted RNA-binding protein with PIN domain
MKNRTIIDGYNLLFACPSVFKEMTPPWPSGSQAKNKKNVDVARDEMLTLISRYQVLTKEEMTVVFDSRWRGRNRPSRRGHSGFGGSAAVKQVPTEPRGEKERTGLKIIFAKSADAEIVRLVEKDNRPKGLTVITSDAKLRKKIKSLGAKVQSTRPFLEKIDKAFSRAQRKAQKEPPEKFRGPKSYEVDYWLKVFEDEEDNG